MAIENDFLPFAVGAGANVLTQGSYAVLAALETGYQAGTAQSAACNKTWRQSSIMAAVLAQFIVAQTNQPAIDDGTTAALLTNFTAAVSAAAKNTTTLADTGAANAYAAANAVPMTALPTASGVLQVISAAHTNTGISTYAPDGLPSAPVLSLGGLALQGGEIVANGIATLVSYVGPLLNGGAVCWVLVSCTGGALAVAPGTASRHAVQVGQLYGTVKGYVRFTSSQLWTSPFSGTAYLTGCAGGGGGGSNATTAPNQAIGGAAGGGAGKPVIRQPITLVAGQTYIITIGAGGAPGNAGGTTAFDTLVTLDGGLPGFGDTAGAMTAYLSGALYGNGYPAGGYGQDTGPVGVGAASGAGASSPFGGGGNQVRGVVAGNPMLPGQNAGGFGAGGSGAGGAYAAGNTTSPATVGAAGGSGTQGFLFLEW